MASRASIVLLVLGLLAACRSYEVTMLEDVVGEYDFRMFRDLFVNTTKQLTQSISQLQENAAKSNTLQDLMDAVEELNESLATLTKHTTSVRDSVNNAADSTTTELQKFQNQVLHKLSDVKLLVESKTKEMEDTVSRFTRLSHNLMAGDCQDLYDMGFNASGVYFLQKFGRQVLCDMESGDGGWLVIQRRAKVVEQVDFNQDWHEYKAGFGDLESEFWAGNDFLHVLTNQKTYKVYIDMVDFEKGPYWASYNNFRVGSERSGYQLDIGEYSGNATDAFTYHHGRPFTSNDRDNDLYASGNCASFFSGGWWYDRCYDAHLNGVYPVTPDRQNASFITWWANEEEGKVPLVLTSVTIRVKPISP
ncbi:techylectin-5B-like [Penaeus indicus]|uniref:techylectin-5B-like n=1 Tax=Penaeus chinensis TaxID=139456 RepID=UPI001FB64876|nr:techylectin-5B-like [Penaeus chinensis]